MYDAYTTDMPVYSAYLISWNYLLYSATLRHSVLCTTAEHCGGGGSGGGGGGGGTLSAVYCDLCVTYYQYSVYAMRTICNLHYNSDTYML